MSDYNRVGERLGKLVAVEIAETKGKNKRFIFECDCGGRKDMFWHSAKATRHCGCLTKERLKKRNLTHGMSSTWIYKRWFSMRQRCGMTCGKGHPRYEGRGIKVCDRWNQSFEAFLEDMGTPKSRDLTIERIDNNGDYCPENCKWATRKDQQNNRGGLLKYKHKDKKLTLSQWSEIIGVKRGTLKGRLDRGWGFEKAISKQAQSKFRKKNYG